MKLIINSYIINIFIFLIKKNNKINDIRNKNIYNNIIIFK